MTESVLTWNLGGKRSCPSGAALCTLSALLEERRPSLVALQESPSGVGRALPAGYQLEIGGGDLATAFLTSAWTLYRSETPLTRAHAVALNHNSTFAQLWLWNLHLPALHVTAAKKAAFIRSDLRPHLNSLRAAAPQRLELIVGDFNLAPYAEVVLSEEGFNANRCLTWVRSGPSSDCLRRRLFNPTWQIYGRASPPRGTFYKSDVEEDGPWCAWDQVVMSPGLALDGTQQVTVIDTVAGKSLCTTSHVGAPKKDAASDHLPLLVEFRALP